MAQAFLTPINLSQLELQNAAIQNLATAPSSPVTGQIYYDTALGTMRQWNGSAWVNIPGSVSGTAGGDLSGSYPNPTVAKVNGTALGTTATTAGTVLLGTGSAIASTAISGDATLSGAGALTIGAGAVSLSKMANLAANSILGNNTGSATAPIALTAAQTKTLLAIVPADVTGFDTQVRTSRLDQMAAPTADVSINSHKLTNVTDPASAQDAATKNYVDLALQGVGSKQSAYYATTAALPSCTYSNGTSGVGATLTATANAALAAQDGQTPALSDVVLVKNQASALQNGLYKITQLGDGTHPFILTRHTDMDQSAEFSGALVAVESGTVNAGALYLCTVNNPTVGTTSIPFTEINKAADLVAGNGITISANTVSAVANTGITVTGSGIGIDTTVVPRKISFNVGDGSSTSITLTHNLGTRDILASVIRATTPWDEVYCDVQAASTNTVTLLFSVAPTTNQYRCTVMG